MKKVLALVFVSIFFLGCNLNTEEFLNETFAKDYKPFTEYKIPNKKTATTIENAILKAETKKYGLDSLASAHLVELTKIGTYATGVVKIMANLPEETFEKINSTRTSHGKIENQYIIYDCTFNYSYKTGQIIWSSDYPYK